MRKHSLILAALAGILFWASSCKKEKLNGPKETVMYETDFSSDDGKWNLSPFPNVSLSINNGYLNITSNTSSNGIDMYAGSFFSASQNNTAIEISLKVERNNTSDNNAAGLIWNKSGSGDTRVTHYFGTSPIGGYLIYGYPNGMNNPSVDYVDWITNSLTKPGDFTKLRIELKDSYFHFLLNGTEVYKMKANAGETLDVAGIFTWGGVKVQVDYFKAVSMD